MSEGWQILLQAGLAGNLVIYAGLGMGVLPQGSKKIETALREGASVTAAVFGATVALWALVKAAAMQGWNLGPVGSALGFVISFLTARGVARFLHLPYRESFVSCAWAAALLAGREGAEFADAGISALGYGLGVGFVWVLLAGVMSRLELAGVSTGFWRLPLFFATLGALALILGKN